MVMRQVFPLRFPQHVLCAGDAPTWTLQDSKTPPFWSRSSSILRWASLRPKGDLHTHRRSFLLPWNFLPDLPTVLLVGVLTGLLL